MSHVPEPYDDPGESTATPASPAQAGEKVPLVVETHGVKVSISKGGPGSEEPSSFREVGQIVKKHLLKILVGPTGLVADAIDACRSALQGVKSALTGGGKIPGAVAQRIARVRAEVDQREDDAQIAALGPAAPASALPPGLAAKATPSLPPSRSPKEILEDIAVKIDELRAKGFDARLVKISENEFAIILVRDGAGDEGVELARYKLEESRSLPAANTGETVQIDIAELDKNALETGLRQKTGEQSDFAKQMLEYLQEAERKFGTRGMEAFESVLKALSSDQDRKIVRLWAIGLPVEAIAERLGANPDLVRQRWYRIQEILRERME